MTLKWQDQRWHTRFYLWAEPIVAQFKDSYSRTDSGDKVHTNLCPYMRTLLVWLPLVFFANIFTVVAAVATATYVPGRLFGWSGYLRTVVVFVVIMALAKLIFWIIGTFIRWYTRWSNAQEISTAGAHGGDGGSPSEVPVDQTPGFWAVLSDYVSRGHDFICPGITITRTRSESER